MAGTCYLSLIECSVTITLIIILYCLRKAIISTLLLEELWYIQGTCYWIISSQPTYPLVYNKIKIKHIMISVRFYEQPTSIN